MVYISTLEDYLAQIRTNPKYKQYKYMPLEHAKIRFKIAKRIIDLRFEAKLTQNELSLMSNIPLRTIVRIEGGLANPSLQTLYSITDVFDAKIEIVPRQTPGGIVKNQSLAVY